MRKLLLVALGLTAGFTLVWSAVNFHVFHTPSGIVVAVKRNPTLADTYVDVRDWGAVQWSEFPDLVWALAQSGHEDVVRTQPVYESVRNVKVEISR